MDGLAKHWIYHYFIVSNGTWHYFQPQLYNNDKIPTCAKLHPYLFPTNRVLDGTGLLTMVVQTMDFKHVVSNSYFNNVEA